jgi:agmatinase
MQNTLPFNFLGLPEEYSTYSTAKVVILPIPYELTLSYESGTRHGPQAIINASRQVETFDDELGVELSNLGIATCPEIEQTVAGPEAMQGKIYSECHGILKDDKFILSLGGEHSITAALVKAHKEKFGRLSVIQIDAHTDLRDSYQGSKFSHACVMARVAEMTDFCSIGTRSFSNDKNEQKYADKIFRPRSWRDNPAGFEKCLAALAQNVYITIDLDGFDPSVMPAVGTPEPGGLSWDEVIILLRTITAAKKVVGADIVELSPRPGLTYADFTAAKLALKVIGFSLSGV